MLRLDRVPFARTRVAFILLGIVAGAGGFTPARAAGGVRPEEPAAPQLPCPPAPGPSAPGSGPVPPAATGRIGVPILVYHIVRPAYADDSKAVRELALTPGTFDAEMRFLEESGYHVVSFADLEGHLRSGAPLPAKPVVLSFDDGWRDQFEYAFPILKEYGYRATFFVFTNAIGDRHFLSWDDLRALRDAGMTIASHSRSHPFLTRIADVAVLRSEIYGSKKTLEEKLGVHVDEFAYPFGEYDSAVVAMVKGAGYTSARGDVWSGEDTSASQLYDLSAVNAPTTLARFERALGRGAAVTRVLTRACRPPIRHRIRAPAGSGIRRPMRRARAPAYRSAPSRITVAEPNPSATSGRMPCSM